MNVQDEERLGAMITFPPQELGFENFVFLDIIKHIEKRRNDVHSSSQILNQIARHLTTALQTSARRLEIMIMRIQIYEFWRWVAMVCKYILLCIHRYGILYNILLDRDCVYHKNCT